MTPQLLTRRLPLLLRSVLHRFEVDRPVFFGLLAKSWSLSTGPITAILIATKFSPEIQGYYFTFATIITLQAFVELGLGAVIVQFAGHEWAKLSLNKYGNIVGDTDALSRLSSIAKIASKWYLVGASVIAFGLSVSGFIFFSNTPHSVDINWAIPWFLLCVITGASICLVPIWSLLEGCNQVAQLYTFRFYQGVVASIVVWIAIISGAGLWTGAISGIAILLVSILFLRQRYWVFLRTLLQSTSGRSAISWRTDILPMQWRMALATVSWFFVYSFFVPIIFRFQGPITAGQMGMTIGIIMAIGNLSFSWFTPKIPQFCILIAECRFNELDKLFFHNTRVTLIILTLTSSVFLLGIYSLNGMGFSLANRLLPPLSATIFMLAYFVGFASAPFSHYMRAHKREPIVFVTVIGSVFTGTATFITGKYYTLNVMAISYLLINIGMTFSIIVIWYFHRSKWQR